MRITTNTSAAAILLLFSSAGVVAQDANSQSGDGAGGQQQPPYNIVPFDPPEGEPARTVESGIVTGMATGFPLNKALLDIVPGTKQLMFDNDLNPNMLISYRGGTHWAAVLKEIERNYSLKFEITDRYVLASKTDAVLITSDPDIKQIETLPHQTGKAPDLSRTVNDRVNAQAQYIAKTGDRVSYVLRTWADAAGWYVSYKTAYDYEIERGRTFTGDFEKNVAELIMSFRGSQVPLRASFYPKSRVILISDNASQ